jgi:hypothetical protein
LRSRGSRNKAAATETAAKVELQVAKDGKVKIFLETILKDAAAARKSAEIAAQAANQPTNQSCEPTWLSTAS